MSWCWSGARPIPSEGVVAPDGSVSFGGDTVGALTTAGRTVEAPASGGLRDAWLSRWAPDGTLQWVDAWGGPGDDLAKGVVDDGDNVSYVGRFTGTLNVGGTALDAGEGADTLVAQRSTTGAVRWATSQATPRSTAPRRSHLRRRDPLRESERSRDPVRICTRPGDHARRHRRRYRMARTLRTGRRPEVRPHRRRHGERARRRDRPDGVTRRRRRHAPRAGEHDQQDADHGAWQGRFGLGP